MDIYYDFPRGSQCGCLPNADDFGVSTSRKNENFAAKPAAENVAQTPMSHGLPAARVDEGVVYANKHTTSSKPAYLSLAQAECQKYEAYQEEHRPRGRHAKQSIKATRAASKKTVRWDGLPGNEKKRLALDYAFRSESVAITINLTPEKLARYLKSDRPAKALADAINKACRMKLGRAVPISLALEISPTGKLHAHGIATLERGEWKGFREALRSAGGKVEGSASGRQTDTRRLWSAKGWSSYMAKAFHETAEALGTDKIFYQCNATRAGAKKEYEQSLQRQKEARRASR